MPLHFKIGVHRDFFHYSNWIASIKHQQSQRIHTNPYVISVYNIHNIELEKHYTNKSAKQNEYQIEKIRTNNEAVNVAFSEKERAQNMNENGRKTKKKQEEFLTTTSISIHYTWPYTFMVFLKYILHCMRIQFVSMCFLQIASMACFCCCLFRISFIFSQKHT